MLSIEIGPFATEGGDDWPVAVDWDELHAQGYAVHLFRPEDGPVPGADATIWWSPEYHDTTGRDLPGYRVAFLGDWHINVPDLSRFDLVATDRRGVREVGRGDPRFVYWRGFSYDPRLHFADGNQERETDVAFCGRDAPGREALRHRVAAWCDRTDRAYEWVGASYERGVEAQVYRRAKIVLGHSQRGELQMRAYEAMACGALYVVQHDCEEAHAPGVAGIVPTYDPAHLEDFLEAWLADEPARAAQVERQRCWVGTERPVDHLEWLCDRIRERLPERPVVVAAPGAAWDVLDLLEQAPEPDLGEQRRECAALVPWNAEDILDLGCGDGGFGWWLKRSQLHRENVFTRPRRVTGVDRDPGRNARHRLDAVRVHDLDDTSTPTLRHVAGDGYDAVTALDVVEHLREPGALLRAVQPLLKPGGTLVLSAPNVRNAGVLLDLLVNGRFPYSDGAGSPVENIRSRDHLRFFCLSDLLALVEDSGFKVAEVAATRMTTSPEVEAWIEAQAGLAARWGADQAWRDAALVVQWLIVARRPE